MKAVIVEIREKYVAVLSDDGCIVKMKNNNYAIGQVIEVKKQITSKFKRIALWTASAVALVITCGVYVYTTPYTYVSLDVNPSIEYSLNRFERVLSVKGVNSDGTEILKEIDPSNLSNKKIDDALKITVEQLSEDGYFDGDVDGGIVISTSSEDLEDAEDLATELGESVIENTEENGDIVEVETISVGKERVKEAKALGVTPGKLNLVQKLQASAKDTDSIDLEEWLNKPVKEIMHAIKENKKAEKQKSSISSPDDDETDIDQDEIDDENDNEDIDEEDDTEQVEIHEENTVNKAVSNEEKVSNKAQVGEDKATDEPVRNEEKVSNKAQVGQEKAAEKKENNQEKAPDKSEKNEKKENSNGNNNGNKK